MQWWNIGSQIDLFPVRIMVVHRSTRSFDQLSFICNIYYMELSIVFAILLIGQGQGMEILNRRHLSYGKQGVLGVLPEIHLKVFRYHFKS
jgi:hypothetical protein